VKRPVVLRPQAGTEAHRAKSWYDEQVRGLGDQFVLALDAAIEAIGQRPEAFPKSMASSGSA
jgi:hypothetical protein